VADFSRYFCSDYHEWVDSVPVLHGTGNQYFVPGLYFHAPFRRSLRSWFPEHGPFGTLAPLLMRPRNAIWARVTTILVTEFENERLKVGIQARGAFPWKSRSTVRGLFMFHLRHCLRDTLNASYPALVQGWEKHQNDDGRVIWSALGNPALLPPTEFTWEPIQRSPEVIQGRLSL